MYKVLADLVVVLHFVFIVFVISGGFFALKWPRVTWLHLPAVVWGVYVEFAGESCPLTPLENWLRGQAGEVLSRGDFVERYLLVMIYPDGLTRDVQVFLGGVVVLINAAVYAWFIRKRWR